MDAFEDLEVWKRSTALAVSAYRMVGTCKERSLKDQITRSAISVPSNIAEGFERNSDKQFAQFLRFAKGSCGELRTQIYLGQKMGLLSPDAAEELLGEALQVSKMLQGLINHCSRSTRS